MPYTITEALQEIKTIAKRIEVKRNNVGGYIVRDSRIKDPLEREGGSFQYIAREMQAVADLETRLINIRTAIQAKNLVEKITVNGTERTIAEWLTWRKEIIISRAKFINNVLTVIKQTRDKILKEGRKFIDAKDEANAQPNEIVVNFNELDLIAEQENNEKTLSELDGKLSLANATLTINV